MAFKKVGEYYILYREIGSGNFSSVWLGMDTRSNQELAFKALKVSKLDSTLQTFLGREIEVMRRVDSPYIVKLLDVVRTANNVYLVLELCKGGSIGDYLKKKGSIPLHLARRWLLQIVDAFIILSGQAIAHRDLKLENVLLSSENDEEAVAKLADFGLTRVLNTDSFILQTKVGSPLYMAPEIIMGEMSSTKVDVWSFGVLANNMLSGPLFRNLLTIPQLMKVQKTTQEDIARSDLPDEVKELLSYTLCYDHRQRATFQEIRNLRFFYGVTAPVVTTPQYSDLPQTDCTSTLESFRLSPVDYPQEILNLNFRLREELGKVASVGVDFVNRNYGLIVIALYQFYVSEVDKCIATATEIQQSYDSPELQQLIYDANEYRRYGKYTIETWQAALSSYDLSRSLMHFDREMWIEPRALKEAADMLMMEADASPDRIEKLRVAFYLLYLGKEDERSKLEAFAQQGLQTKWILIGDSWDQQMNLLLTQITAAEQNQAW